MINSRENEWNSVEFTEGRTFIVPRNLTTLGLNVTYALGKEFWGSRQCISLISCPDFWIQSKQRWLVTGLKQTKKIRIDVTFFFHSPPPPPTMTLSYLPFPLSQGDFSISTCFCVTGWNSCHKKRQITETNGCAY